MIPSCQISVIREDTELVLKVSADSFHVGYVEEPAGSFVKYEPVALTESEQDQAESILADKRDMRVLLDFANDEVLTGRQMDRAADRYFESRYRR